MQQPTVTPTPQVAPAPAPAALTPAPTGSIRLRNGVMVDINSPAAIHEAARNQRSELRDQREELENQRSELARQLRMPQVEGADKKGLEARIATLDERIADVEKQIAAADANVSRTAAIPGSQPAPGPRPPDPGPPEEFWVLTGIFLFVVGLPLSIAYARRIWKKSVGAVSALPQEIYERFNRIDHAIDAVAIEVERVGEGQRYLTRVHEQQKALGAGPAERLEAAEREREQQLRK
jgi:hypothetical protein